MKGIGPYQQRDIKLAKKNLLLTSHRFNDEPLSCTEAMLIMAIDNHATGHRLLSEMVSDMQVQRSGTPGKYKYSKPAPRWSQKKWRKRSNERIGITASPYAWGII